MPNEARYVATDASKDSHHAWVQRKFDTRLRRATPRRQPIRAGAAQNKSTVTTLVSEPEAPAASVTVTRIVKSRGRTMMYVCPTVNVPWLVLLPVLVEPSPQSIVYDHGPLPSRSVKLASNE